MVEQEINPSPAETLLFHLATSHTLQCCFFSPSFGPLKSYAVLFFSIHPSERAKERERAESGEKGVVGGAGEREREREQILI